MISQDFRATILVKMESGKNDPNYIDFNYMADEVLNDTASGMKEKGMITDSYVYAHKQTKFLVLCNLNSMSCLTSINGQEITLTMVSHQEDVSDSLEKTIKSVLDSIVFTKVSSKPASSAERAQCKLPELKMTIKAPAGWATSARNVKDGDPGIAFSGMSIKKLADYFKKNGIFSMLICPDFDAVITVGMDDTGKNKYIDFNLMTDEQLLAATKMQNDSSITGSAIYLHKQTKFLILIGDKSIDYLTFINGQMIAVTLSLHEGKMTRSLEETLKSVVSSIEFTKVSSKPIAPPGSDAAELKVPELNMTVKSPEGWAAFNQDIDENDLFLPLLGIDAKELEEQYKENGVYLDMISEYPYDHITVTVKESDDPDIYDYNDLSDEDLLKLASEMKGEKEQVIANPTVYKHKQAKFAVFDYTDKINSQPAFGKLYITVINGQKITIMLQSMSEVSDSLAKTFKDTVDGITFTKVTKKPPEAEAATVEVPELKIKIDSPKEWYVFTQDVKEGDPVLDYLGVDSKGLADAYKANGTYLSMIRAKPGAKIFVEMIDSEECRDIYDLNPMNDGDALLSVSKIKDMQKQTHEKIEFSDGAVYKHKQAKFVFYNYTWETEGKTVYGIQYCTVKNGQAVVISMESDKRETTDSLGQTLKSTVDSITFTKVMPKAADDIAAVFGSLAGAAVGAVIGAAVISIRKRRYA